MDYKQLSKRLQRVAEFVPQNTRLADIGSDHAYLPAYLILHNQIQSAIAGEVVEGPFLSAKKLVEHLQLTEKIDVRKGDGLAVISPSDGIETVTICGMGGTLIRDILDRGHRDGKLTGKELLILQPNIGEKNIRIWLSHHQYQLVSESIIRENEKTYEILVAKKTTKEISLTEKEALFGPILIKEKNTIFLNKWQHELHQAEIILSQLNHSKKDVTTKISEIKTKINLMKEVLQ